MLGRESGVEVVRWAESHWWVGWPELRVIAQWKKEGGRGTLGMPRRLSRM